MAFRATLREQAVLPPAVGVITRRQVSVILEPAEPGAGVRVRRKDLGREWPVDLAHVISANNCTTVAAGEDSLAFVEHLMAALWAARISDVSICVDGPEIPLYDGSAAPFTRALAVAGRVMSEVPWSPLVVKEPVCLVEDERVLIALPAPQVSYGYLLEHPHPLISRQFARFSEPQAFGSRLAPARTFATIEEIRSLYGDGVGPEAERLCLIVYPDHLSDTPTLPDAFARHKVLDLIGDLYLCGSPLVGEIIGCRTGHRDNHRLLTRLLAEDA